MNFALKQEMSDGFKRLLPDIKESRVDAFEIYYNELMKWQKKINFLKNIVYRLSLSDVIFHNMRIEDFFTDGDFTGYFDVIVSRAISMPDNVISDFKQLLRKNGLYVRKGCSDSKDIESSSFNAVRVENPWNKSNPYIYYVYTLTNLQKLNDKKD